MVRLRRQLTIISFFVVLFGVCSALLSSQESTVRALQPPPYSAPDTLTVTMYALTEDGAIRGDCVANDYRYGCTKYCIDPGVPASKCHGTRFAPFPYNTNPTIVDIEDDYLVDVLAEEISPNIHHPNAIKAQAIAARTFSYYFDAYNETLNNSASERQVFVPYAFDGLGYSQAFPGSGPLPCDPELTQRNTAQQIICNATATRLYISYNYTVYGDDYPAFTQFSNDTSDTINRTVQGYYQNGDLVPNLLPVDDPIATSLDVRMGGHGIGLSQNGASRWAYGTLGYQGNLSSWSVQWPFAERILVHYYANVHIRRAYNTEITTAEYRWNPLEIDWGNATPSGNGIVQMQPASTYNVEVTIQNSGTQNWSCGSGHEYYLRYYWVKNGNSDIGSTYTLVCNIQRADPSQIVMLAIVAPQNPGTYRLSLDIWQYDVQNNVIYRFSEPNASGNSWPTYDALVCVGYGEGCGTSFMPILTTLQ